MWTYKDSDRGTRSSLLSATCRRYQGSPHRSVNCGAVGKPDHDGDTAVHYAVLDALGGTYDAEIRRVPYDHPAWASQLRNEGVDSVFVEPLLTGVWTTGVASLPEAEQPVQLRPLAVGRRSAEASSRGV